MQMKIYLVIDDTTEERSVIAIFMSKNLAECYIDDMPFCDYKIIELKGENDDD